MIPAIVAVAKNTKSVMDNHRKEKKEIVVLVTGGFDPIHVGHVRLFNDAKALGDRLVVAVNNDNWLMKKKGFVFMPQDERKEVIEAFRSVDEVVFTNHEENPDDMSVCEVIKSIKPDIFANGGDRDFKNSQDLESSLSPEYALCSKLGIHMEFNVGKGGKVQSSSWLLEKYKNFLKERDCTCGSDQKLKRCHG